MDFEHEQQHVSVDIISVEIPLAILVCSIYVLTSYAIHRFKANYSYAPSIHESSVACIAGLILGGLIKLFTGEAVKFDNTLFFYLVLPPIIFSAGFGLKRKKFFRYIGMIALFGIAGTILNFLLIAFAAYYFSTIFGYDHDNGSGPASDINLTWLQAMLLSAVLSASDEVSALSLVRMQDFPRLGALIFGEGVLNDALSIVLFKALLSAYLATLDNPYSHTSAPADPLSLSASSLAIKVIMQLLLSTVIGLTCGLLNARMFKLLPNMRLYPIHQTSLVMLCGYGAYSLAEAVGVSGILTLFVSAVAQSHYSWHSLSKSSQLSTRISFVAISDIAEGFAFSYVGLSLWGVDSNELNILFSLYMLVVVVCCRFITIFSISAASRLLVGGERFSVTLKEQFTFALGGVVRGCLCWAQVLQMQGQTGTHFLLSMYS